MKTKYANGLGPNWMDRYVDPATGAKFKWNYKPKKSPPRTQRVAGLRFEHATTCACGILPECKARRSIAAAANTNSPQQQKEAA